MIFEDPTRKRWKCTLIAFALIGLLGVTCTFLFAASLILTPPLPSVRQFARAQRTAESILRQSPDIAKQSSHSISRNSPHAPSTATGGMATIPQKGHSLVTAFLVQKDQDSINAFIEHSSQLDIVFPDWFFLTGERCTVDERIDAKVQELLRQSDVAVFPRVTNGDGDSWHTPQIRTLLRSGNDRDCTVRLLASFAKKIGVRGLNMDIEAIGARDRDTYLEFLTQLTQKLHAQGQLLTVDITANNPAYDVEQIGAIADAVVLMNYDEHYLTSAPGPIASQDWFESNLRDIVHRVPPNKVIIAMANYGDDWAPGQPTNSMTFPEVMALADDSGVLPQLDAASRNMHFLYRDGNGHPHDVWFLGSVEAWNALIAIRRAKVLGTGLWRLGSEDPTLWQFLTNTGASAASLRTPFALRSILSISQGEIFQMASQPHAGSMLLEQDESGSVVQAQYDVLPSGYLLRRIGDALPPKTLLLTFDDGPDPQWTPQILSILSSMHVPATFFLVGEQVQKYPTIVRQMHDRGFTVGNHTYLHPDLSQVSTERIRLELNSTQRVIEEEYGRKTILFRAPYSTDTNPDNPAQLDPLRTVTDLGYIIVGANIDVADWQRPDPDLMATRIIAAARHPENHIIVLHDAGGDRSHTVAALKIFIPTLRAQGYRFITFPQATHLTEDTLWPVMEPREALLVHANTLLMDVWNAGWLLIFWLFLFTTLLAIARIAFLGTLVLGSLRSTRRRLHRTATAHVPVSILIPAYNEEKTIMNTIQSILRSGHAHFEIVVIDDGSTDGTRAIVRRLQEEDSRIRLITQPHSGKSEALNHGLREARDDIVITVDADTVVLRHSIAALIAPFEDPAVDAVCGNVEVGNVRNLLTGFQSLEYITTQNFDRRAFDVLNCISVIPGATGAWRRKKILVLGGYTHDTLTEDADLTLTLLRNNGTIVYAPLARACTEAPATISALAKQRFRWSFGTFQCLWKHRRALFRGSLGWIALPNMFFFQILFPVLSPIGDVVFVISLLRGDIRAIAIGYVLFLFMDLCGSLLAFTLEKRPKKLMWLILIQRFFYRQFMYVITFRAMLAILHGGRYGWNKIERSGLVHLELRQPS